MLEIDELQALRWHYSLRRGIRSRFLFVTVITFAGRVLFGRQPQLPPGLLVKQQRWSASFFTGAMLLYRHLKGTQVRRPSEGLLFDSFFYLIANQDVARSRVAPWVHYQLFGRVEGRSPHPLVDVTFLSKQMGVPAPDALDIYLSCNKYWMLSPSPYFDIYAFTNSGQWDGFTNPLIQVIQTSLFDQRWIKTNSILIDAGQSPSQEKDALAARVLGILNRGIAYSRSISLISRRDAVQTYNESSEIVRVVPGSWLVSREGVLQIGSEPLVLSEDHTLFATEDCIYALNATFPVVCMTLVVMKSEVSFEALKELMASSLEGAVIAPSSQIQFELLTYFNSTNPQRRIEILPLGEQALLVPKYVRVYEAEEVQKPKRLHGVGGQSELDIQNEELGVADFIICSPQFIAENKHVLLSFMEKTGVQSILGADETCFSLTLPAICASHLFLLDQSAISLTRAMPVNANFRVVNLKAMVGADS